jgi:hypothetical protein
LEAKQLKLAAEHFPLPSSLQSLVLDLYAPHSEVNAGQAMALNEVLGYLKNIDAFELGPLAAILAQTEAMGDPALPSSEQTAILEWLNAAYAHWEEQFPVEEPLASQFRKLLPLAAALAITDPNFLTPGAHNFHRLLDIMQAAVVGWQARLGRAGQSLERELATAIEKARGWFGEGSVDLEAVYQEVLAATRKDRGRAQRMAQRVVEAEQGRLKTLHAKTRAAQMINALLERYQAPAGIGEFLKGPWYESGQLLLLRFGPESGEWASMSATTEALLDSLQSEPAAPTDEKGKQNGSRRQQVFEAITKLPRELKRWLVSLKHDDDGVEHAMGIIESAHMAVLRQQDLSLQPIEPIPVTTGTPGGDDPQVQECVQQLNTGQWFLFCEENGDPLRAQLVLKMEDEQQLLFTNQAGIKAMQRSFADFAADLKTGKSTPLYSEVSFSCSLAQAAKITSSGDLDSLNSSAATQARQDHKDAIQKQREQEQAAIAEAKRESEEEERLRIEFEQAIQAKQKREEAEALRREHEQGEEQLAQEEASRSEQEEAARVKRKNEESQRRQREQALARHIQQEKAAEEQAKAEAARQRQRGREQPDPEEGFLSAPHVENTSPAPQSIKAGKVRLTMGAWLGFHDGDKPLLAKLAAHDREEDNYIFVNREGIKMRDLSKQELVSLMDKGQIEILEARSSFRDEDTRARNKQKD